MPSSKGDINEAVRQIQRGYNETAQQTQRGVNATSASFGEASRNVGLSYDEMTRALQTQANATASGLGSQFSMLGIGAAQDAATQQLRGQLNQSLISAARRKAAGVSSLRDQGAMYKAAGLEGVGNVRREGTQVQAESRTKLMDSLLGLEQAEAEAKGQYALQKLQGEIELAQMQQQMKAAAARARGGGGGRSGSPLDLLRAQLMGLDIQQKMQELQQGPSQPWDNEGQGGLNRFLNSPSDYWDDNASGAFRGDLQGVIDYASAQSTRPGRSGIDPMDYAMERTNNEPSNFRRDALRQALQIYYG